MKNSISSKKSLFIYKILGWTLLLNLCLFSGLYLFFRTDISQSLSNKTPQPIQSNSTRTQLVAKSIPISNSAGELISQTLPKTGHPPSAVADTVIPTVLPTLLEPPLNDKPATPVTMTKIVKIPQPVFNNLVQSDKITRKASSPFTSSRVNDTPSVNVTKVPDNPVNVILTERDLPTKNHMGVPSQINHQQQNELAVRTAQLSEAITVVKRLNQQAIDKANAQ